MEQKRFLAFFCKFNCNSSFTSLNKLMKHVITTHDTDTSVTFNDCAKLHCSQCNCYFYPTEFIVHISFCNKAPFNND